jgi:two-component system sensor histidine kinase MtrB
LGLAIALEDARLHGGWLQAWGERGKGSVFRLTVPRTLGQELAGSPLPLGPDEAELAGGGPLAGRPGAAVAGFGLADVVGSGGTPAEVLPDGDGHLAAIDKRVTAGNGRLAVGNESPAAGNGGSAAGNGEPNQRRERGCR